MDEHHHHHRFEFSPLFISLLVIIAIAIILTIYQSITYGFCSQRQTPTDRIRNQEQRRKGSSERNCIEIELLPEFRYTEECKEVICAVCLCEFRDGEMIRVLPECMHSFHSPCVDMWLYSHTNCPLCRTPAVSPQYVVSAVPESGRMISPEIRRLPESGV